MDYETLLFQLKDSLLKVNSSKVNDGNLYALIFNCVQRLQVSAITSNDSIIFANTNVAILEDIFNTKFIFSSVTCQSIIVNFLKTLYYRAPGYAVRNFITAIQTTLLNSKTATATAKEAILLTIGKILIKRSSDCGNMVIEVFQNVLKLVKNTSETSFRIVGLNAMENIIVGAQDRLSDLISEVLKVCSKFLTDKSIDVRIAISNILSACCSVSTLQPDVILPIIIKGLEDEVGSVQLQYAKTLSTLLYEQILIYTDQKDKLKIGLARSSDSGKNESVASKKKVSLQDRMKMNLISTKKYMEEYQFRSVIQFLLKSIIKTISNSQSTLRNGYIATLSFLVKEFIVSL